MKDKLERRLQELKSEYQSGQRMIANLESKISNLQTILLRISGAIQVLEEELKINNDNHETMKAQYDGITIKNSQPH